MGECDFTHMLCLKGCFDCSIKVLFDRIVKVGVSSQMKNIVQSRISTPEVHQDTDYQTKTITISILLNLQSWNVIV